MVASTINRGPKGHWSSRATMATICRAVLTLPKLLAGMTTPSTAATILRPDTANSLPTIKMAVQDDTRPISTRVNNAAATNSLSAKGSINWPKRVTSFADAGCVPV